MSFEKEAMWTALIVAMFSFICCGILMFRHGESQATIKELRQQVQQCEALQEQYNCVEG